MSHRPPGSNRHQRIDARPVAAAFDDPAVRAAVGGRRLFPGAERRVVRPVFARQSRGITTCSDDGVIEFLLMPQAGSLHVERIELRGHCGRVVHTMSFHARDDFDRWCLTDRLQFAYPLFYANLRRSGHELFDAAI